MCVCVLKTYIRSSGTKLERVLVVKKQLGFIESREPLRRRARLH